MYMGRGEEGTTYIQSISVAFDHSVSHSPFMKIYGLCVP